MLGLFGLFAKQQGAKQYSPRAMMVQLAVSDKDSRPVFAGGVEPPKGSGAMYMPGEYAPFQRQTVKTTSNLRKVLKYVSD